MEKFGIFRVEEVVTTEAEVAEIAAELARVAAQVGVTRARLAEIIRQNGARQ